MRALRAACAAVLLLAQPALAQDDASSTTQLTFSGALSDQVSGSNTNACVFEDGNFRAQLTGVGAASILSFEFDNADVGSFPLRPNATPKVSMVTLSDDPNEFLVNWYSNAGTLTIDSLDTQVPLDDGSASTKGASGSVEADLSATNHGTVHLSGAWACHMPF